MIPSQRILIAEKEAYLGTSPGQIPLPDCEKMSKSLDNRAKRIVGHNESDVNLAEKVPIHISNVQK